MIRYQLALLGHSQRWLPPGLAYVVLLGLLYSDAGGPPVPEFAISAGGLTVVACWLTIALAAAEDPVQRLITVVHASGVRRVLTGVVGAVLGCCLALTVLSLLLSFLRHNDSAQVLLLGLAAHAACALTGVAIGLPCSRLLVPRIGYTLIAALLALLAVVRIPWLPLVHPMLRSLSDNALGLAPVLTGLATSAVAVALSTGVVAVLVNRRS